MVYLWIVLAVVDIVVVVVVVVGSEQNASVFAFKKENKIAMKRKKSLTRIKVLKI